MVNLQLYVNYHFQSIKYRGDNLNESQFCVEQLVSTEYMDSRILILYPYELSNEQILKDNISKMTKVIREYIKESDMYRKYVDMIPNLIWDSQKISMQNEADEHQRKADELAEIMNEGISPYAWYVEGSFNGEINGFYYNVDNIVYLDKN